MRLSDFLRTNSEQILRCWDEFASTIDHAGAQLDKSALRDHAGQILSAIADDLDLPQTAAQQVAKSRGEGPRHPGGGDTAAETHADTRIDAGFGINAMLTEYRALRASVLSMWGEAGPHEAVIDELRQLTRFNEAIDQAIAESVARYSAQMERSNNLFMGMLGHDIRNPLGTIRLSAELLKRSGQITPAAVEPIVNAVRRIQGIVELIVDFSRAQSSGVMPIHPHRFHFGTLAENLLAETRVRHPATTFELVNQGLDGYVQWDEGRLGQLLSNLLENAVLYGARGGPVTLTLAGDADQVTFSVHNAGRPIAAAERERIFEPRQRGQGALAEQRTSSGLGLGLYICREIVRSHGGTLAVRSSEGEGTTFTSRLPRRSPGLRA